MLKPNMTPAFFNSIGKNHFPTYVGIEITAVEENRLVAEMPIRQELFAPNTFVHAGSLVTLADTAAGYAAIAHLPEGAKSFTTVELKTNFIGAAREGVLVCEATPVHLGRTTQVWDAVISRKDSGKRVALFRCTQMVLY